MKWKTKVKTGDLHRAFKDGELIKFGLILHHD